MYYLAPLTLQCPKFRCMRRTPTLIFALKTDIFPPAKSFKDVCSNFLKSGTAIYVSTEQCQETLSRNGSHKI